MPDFSTYCMLVKGSSLPPGDYCDSPCTQLHTYYVTARWNWEAIGYFA